MKNNYVTIYKYTTLHVHAYIIQTLPRSTHKPYHTGWTYACTSVLYHQRQSHTKTNASVTINTTTVTRTQTIKINTTKIINRDVIATTGG